MEAIDPVDLKHSQNAKHDSELEIPFPIFPTVIIKTTGYTKINIIKQTIPITISRIMNLTFLSFGTSLNLLIVLVILTKPSMRTSSNLYIVSLACANMVLLLEPLEEIVRWFFDVNLNLNMDYIWLINFDVSIITIAISKFMLYICMFQHSAPFGHVLVKRYTSIKAICLVWISCTLSTAVGLHVFDYFEGDMADIYVWCTIMFVAMPFVIFVVLDSLIICELMILKAIEGSWRMCELRHFYMFVLSFWNNNTPPKGINKRLKEIFLTVIIAVVFFLIRTPYRISRAINFIAPKALCCTDSKREVLSFMAKTFPIIFPIIYISFCVEFRKTFQELVRCKRRSSEEILTDVIV